MTIGKRKFTLLQNEMVPYTCEDSILSPECLAYWSKMVGSSAVEAVLENHTLSKAEDEKFSKHESSYAAVGYAFSPFVLGCFGGIGSQAARFLCTLAFLELRQHDAISERAGLAQLSPSDLSQFRARCFRHVSTRISAALAKATVLRRTGASSLPSPTYLPHCFFASNCSCLTDLLPRRGQLLSSSPSSPSSYA